MKLVPNARRSWRWFSMQLATLAGIAPIAWTQMPDEWRMEISPAVMGYIGLGWLLVFIIARLVDQDGGA